MNRERSTASIYCALVVAAALGVSAALDGPAISDSWITAKTKMSLAADGRVKGRRVSVETKDGRVLLRGKVDDESSKSAAEEVARGIGAVKGVKNELQVPAPVHRGTTEEIELVKIGLVRKDTPRGS